ncbi:MAG: immunity 17 family protein [Prevotella sp.]|nr:immunity 17 family protein [Prevotella sp.]
MEWLNNIYHSIESLLSNLAQYIQSNSKVSNLIAIFLLLFWLIGLIFNWQWTYKGNGSYGWNQLLEALGPDTFRFWLGVFITICILILIYIFIKS